MSEALRALRSGSNSTKRLVQCGRDSRRGTVCARLRFNKKLEVLRETRVRKRKGLILREGARLRKGEVGTMEGAFMFSKIKTVIL